MKIDGTNMYLAFLEAFLTLLIIALVGFIGWGLWMVFKRLSWWAVLALGVFAGLVLFFYIRDKRQDDADAANGYRRYLDEDEREAMNRHMKQHPELYERKK